MNKWVKAFRLRTLPLALSCVITGSAIAFSEGDFSWSVFVLTVITTLFLQILSNLANDYGDALKGTDNDNRVGPTRSIQSGEITLKQMKKAIILFVSLSFFSGVSLVFYSTSLLSIWVPVSFILVGVFSIVAAIKYTAGKGAYGYKGLGDLFVFVFFGLVGVIGTAALQTNIIVLDYLLPAMTIGLFSTAVLNLNNMRDWENDKACGKRTLVVNMGISKAKRYHNVIIIIGMLSALFFVVKSQFQIVNLLFVLSFLPLIAHLNRIAKIEESQKIDPELKKVALSTFVFSILFWISLAQ